jgi:UDP:flavonoid glycosyltransferase YjiC (YdhE family)
MTKIAFYISGHGLGHAVRSKALMLRLLEYDPSIELFVMGTTPRWLFDERPLLNARHRRLRCDVGAVQTDSLRLDVEGTLKENANFFREMDALVSAEAEFIRKERVTLVVGDIPPLAFLAAAAAGVKSVALGNFSWDWIYEDYVLQYPSYGYLIDLVRKAYAKADLLLRLPFHGEMNAFSEVVDIPLIARKSAATGKEVRNLLGIKKAEKRKVVFISLGGHRGAEIAAQAAGDFGDFIFVSFFKPGNGIANLVILRERATIPHQDIVKASDLVISKPGYSTVAECIANRTPLMYTSRDDFREYAIMEDAVRRFCQSYHLPRGDFHRGEWRQHLERFFATGSDFTWPELPFDGADRAAMIILDYAR